MVQICRSAGLSGNCIYLCVCLCRLQRMGAVSETDVQFWMAKAVSWGEATSCSTLLDTSRHLDNLRSFLQQVLLGLQQMV